MTALKRSLLFLTSLLLIYTGALSALAATAASERAALQAVDQEWVQAHNAGDAAKLASLYAKDAVLLPPGAPPVQGQKAIHEFFTQDVAAAQKAGITLHLHPLPGGVSGNMGWCSGTYTATDKSGKVVDTGKYLSVSRKVGGVWRYVRDTWNSDEPMQDTEIDETKQ